MRVLSLLLLVSTLFVVSCRSGESQLDTVDQSHKVHDGAHEHQGEGHGHGHDDGHGHGHLAHQGHANAHMHQMPFDTLVKRFESPERDNWQKPEEVLALLGPLQDKKVMDLGAGTGYFSLKLAEAGATVIAADVDERFLDYINTRLQDHPQKTSVTTKKVPFHSSELKPGELDMLLIVDTYHHIEDRIAYFEEVKNGLADDGELVVIDFLKSPQPFGPPVEMKIAAEQVQKELTESGFTEFELNKELLPHQFILRAR